MDSGEQTIWRPDPRLQHQCDVMDDREPSRAVLYSIVITDDDRIARAMLKGHAAGMEMAAGMIETMAESYRSPEVIVALASARGALRGAAAAVREEIAAQWPDDDDPPDLLGAS